MANIMANMEPPREEEKRTAKKHLAARHGVGSEEDGVHLAGKLSPWRSAGSGGEL